jgi:delta-aminolevulinic acid dehydratase/porphobilinogen synthase
MAAIASEKTFDTLSFDYKDLFANPDIDEADSVDGSVKVVKENELIAIVTNKCFFSYSEHLSGLCTMCARQNS